MKDLKVLLIEDSEQDADLILREIRKGGYSPIYRRIETRDEMHDALKTDAWDIILCDHALPHFNSAVALGLLRAVDHDLPFIIVSGYIGEEIAVLAMKSGANDYIMKGNLKRLVPAIEREVRDAAARRERKRFQEELQRNQEELRRREEELRVAKQVELMKDEFIGMVSHELKNPLTIIIGALKVAMDSGVSEDEANELIRDALDGAGSLTTIIDNLLELTRSQKKRLTLEMKECDVGRIAQTVIQGLKGKSAIHHLVVDVPENLPVIHGDPVRIERILYNSVDNAIKYSPKGGEVRVCISPGDKDLVISISDQGVGISPQDQQRLFKHFERLENCGNQEIDGVGLGLRVCQILTEAHGGSIWLESERGKGSTFFFSFPLNDSQPNSK